MITQNEKAILSISQIRVFLRCPLQYFYYSRITVHLYRITRFKDIRCDPCAGDRWYSIFPAYNRSMTGQATDVCNGRFYFGKDWSPGRVCRWDTYIPYAPQAVLGTCRRPVGRNGTTPECRNWVPTDLNAYSPHARQERYRQGRARQYGSHTR